MSPFQQLQPGPPSVAWPLPGCPRVCHVCYLFRMQIQLLCMNECASLCWSRPDGPSPESALAPVPAAPTRVPRGVPVGDATCGRCNLWATRWASGPDPRGRSSGCAPGLLPHHRPGSASNFLGKEFGIEKVAKSELHGTFLMLILQFGIVCNYIFFYYCL